VGNGCVCVCVVVKTKVSFAKGPYKTIKETIFCERDLSFEEPTNLVGNECVCVCVGVG